MSPATRAGATRAGATRAGATTAGVQPGRQVRQRDHLWDMLIFVAAITPLLITSHIPLPDLPNHMASQFIVGNWADLPNLRDFYQVRFAITPNMAFELFSALAMPVLPIESIARIFCILTLGLIFLGVRWINLALDDGRLRAYRLTPFLLYAAPFQFGFLNYWFSVGLGLLAFGAWLRWRDRPAIVVVPLFIAIGSLIMACHLAGFGLFAIAVAAAELASAQDAARHIRGARAFAAAFVRAAARRAVYAAAFLLPPLIMLSAVSDPDGTARGIGFATLQQKAEAFAAITMFSSPFFELPLLLLALLGALLALLSRTARLHQVGWPMAVLMFVAVLALPRSANGTQYIDYRIPPAAALFCLACVVRGPGLRWRRPLAIGLGTLAIARVASICVLWTGWETTLNRIDAAFRLLPKGSHLEVADGSRSTSLARQPALWNIGGLAVVRQQVFVPYLFTTIGSVIRYRQQWEPFHRTELPKTVDRLDPTYDHLLVIDPGSVRLPENVELRPLVVDPKFVLYSVGARSAGEGAALDPLGPAAPDPDSLSKGF